MKCVIVCVEYDDLLAITVPRNGWRFEEILIVTSPEDKRTQDLARYTLQVDCLATDAFSKGGSTFNKGAALNEGLEAIGMDGWIVVMDADVIIPADAKFGDLEPGKMYGCRRRILADPLAFRDDLDWSRLPLERNVTELPGYFHLFHARDPVLAGGDWYPETWRHAGGYDTEFQERWPWSNKRWLPFPVIHLGPPWTNWCGRATPRTDTGEVSDRAEERSVALQDFMAKRRRLQNYSAEKIG
jgi:hypothetical protein